MWVEPCFNPQAGLARTAIGACALLKLRRWLVRPTALEYIVLNFFHLIAGSWQDTGFGLQWSAISMASQQILGNY